MSTAKDKAAGKGAQKAAEIIQMLVTRPARIESADINTWTTAVNSYKQGNRTKLNDLYETLISLRGNACAWATKAMERAKYF